jgi:hypothetical protein
MKIIKEIIKKLKQLKDKKRKNKKMHNLLYELEKNLREKCDEPDWGVDYGLVTAQRAQDRIDSIPNIIKKARKDLEKFPEKEWEKIIRNYRDGF